MTSRHAVVATVLVAACSHSTPFQTSDGTPQGPHTIGNPLRLTFNPAQDLAPSWLDSNTIIYTWESSAFELFDRCAATVPSGGGTRRDVLCSRSVGSLDSTESYTWPATRDQRVAFVFEQSLPPRLNPDLAQLRVADLSSPEQATALHPFPIDVQGSKVDGAAFLSWLSDTELVYLAESVNYPRPLPGAPPDTVRQGIGIVVLDLAAGSAPAFLPGTDLATSLSVADGGNAIDFTVAGDTKVYRLDTGTGTVASIWDFGSLGIARDVQVRGNWLSAVVGGVVTFQVDPIFGPQQIDSGGRLWVVDLLTDQSSELTGLPNHLFRHPSLRSDGRLAVRAFAAPPMGLVSSLSDIYLFEFGQ